MLLTILMMFTVISVQCQGGENNLQVTSPAGQFRGTILTSVQGHKYKAFMGIPFALPPIEDLRFAKPKPYPQLKDIYNATIMGPICIQPRGVDLGSPGQEDCLYLNIFAPLNGMNEQKKKVFVYIYGGAFFMGSSNEYIPGDLVAMGDVIAVTFNYRLSWLGFLKGDTVELPGNQGMWDQLMALNWVKDNIESFGGDSDDITLGGNSMGGESISALSIVPQGKGLFTKGLIMSGTMFTSKSTPGSSDVLLDMLTDRVGCASKETDPKDIDTIVKCLRGLPAEKFILPHENHITNKFTTIDGDLFSAPIKNLISDNKYLQDVGFFSRKYLVTLTNNEGAIYFLGPSKTGIEPEDLEAEFLSKKFNIPTVVAQKVLDWYKQPGHYSFKPAYDIFSDPILAMPPFKFLETFSTGVKKIPFSEVGKSYFLWFDHSPSYLPLPHEGTFHSVDLNYLFDLQPQEVFKFYYSLDTDEGFTEEDFQMKKLYINILTDFMKNGNPGLTLTQHFNLTWPEFDIETEHYLSFDTQPSMKQFPLYERRQFWDLLFPQYMEEYAASQAKTEL